MKRTINPFRALALGYRYHELYQRFASAEATIKHQRGQIASLSALAERKMNACRSLERQKQNLLNEIAALTIDSPPMGAPTD